MNPLKFKNQIILSITGHKPFPGGKSRGNSIKIILLFIATLTLSDCKKGEDDPIFSFRTRRARVEGKWRLQTGNVTLLTKDLNLNTSDKSTFKMENSKVILSESINGLSPDEYEGAYILSLNCTKDGKMDFYELLSGKAIEASGEWSFNAAGQGKKGKEFINMEIKNVSVGQSSGYALFNQNKTFFSYRIKELRNKKMVLVADAEIYQDSYGKQQSLSAEYTFIQ